MLRPISLSKAFFQFCLCFGISLKTGIPSNPQGQGIVEQAHQTLKAQLSKQKGGIEYTAPANRLNHDLFALNFLNFDKQGKSAAEWFWGPSEQQHPLVM
jgi:transposase InsO family protein